MPDITALRRRLITRLRYHAAYRYECAAQYGPLVSMWPSEQRRHYRAIGRAVERLRALNYRIR